MTPTTSYDSPFSRIVRPTSVGIAPKRRDQSACDNTTRRFVAGHGFVVREGSAKQRLGLQRAEETGRDAEAIDLLRLVDSRQVRIPEIGGRKPGQRRALAHPVTVVGRRHRRVIRQRIAFRRRGHHDEAFDAGEAEGPEIERVGERENRGVGGQRQREGGDNRAREGRPVHHGPQRVSPVAQPCPTTAAVGADIEPGPVSPRRGRRQDTAHREPQAQSECLPPVPPARARGHRFGAGAPRILR